MSEPKDRSGSEPGKTFDEAWESMPASSAEPSEGGTRAWTEEVRAARKHDADAKDEPAEAPSPPRTEETMPWTEEVRAERKRDAPLPSDADEMDRLMRAEPTEAPPEEEIPPSASTSAMSFDALDLPAGKPDESLMDALMGAVEASKADPEETEHEELPPPIVLHPQRQPKPRPEPEAREPKPKPMKSRVPLLVGGTVAAALALWFARDPVAPPKGPDAKSLGAVSKPGELDPAEPVPPTSPDLPRVDAPESAEEVQARPKPDRSPPKIDPGRDPREPPEGTPEEIAAVFVKLPVSPADRAPVGGVGKTGIHVDDVTMGSTYDSSRCEGGDGSFSVSKDDLANVCLRFVHQREKEEVVVVWQKVDGNARRGKIVVKPLHAYRTRAYLKLRSEYVGEWEVTVFSEDGVELARYPFTVVP